METCLKAFKKKDIEKINLFEDRFGIEPEIWHSKISNSEKAKIWNRCYLGESNIIVGTCTPLIKLKYNSNSDIEGSLSNRSPPMMCRSTRLSSDRI